MIKDGIEYSDIFDGVCYLKRYPDVAADGKYNTADKAFNHWIDYGQYEGRIPGCEIGPAKPGSGGQPINNDGGIPQTTAPGAGGNNGTIFLFIAVAAILLLVSNKPQQ